MDEIVAKCERNETPTPCFSSVVRSGSPAEHWAAPPFELERNSKPVTTNGLPRRREVTARRSSRAPEESYIPVAVLAAALRERLAPRASQPVGQSR